MSKLLEEGQTPEAWSEKLRGHGVYVSPRLIRSKAHRTGQFYKIGRLMLLTPGQLEALITPPSELSSKVDVKGQIDG